MNREIIVLVASMLQNAVTSRAAAKRIAGHLTYSAIETDVEIIRDAESNIGVFASLIAAAGGWPQINGGFLVASGAPIWDAALFLQETTLLGQALFDELVKLEEATRGARTEWVGEPRRRSEKAIAPAALADLRAAAAALANKLDELG